MTTRKKSHPTQPECPDCGSTFTRAASILDLFACEDCNCYFEREDLPAPNRGKPTRVRRPDYDDEG